MQLLPTSISTITRDQVRFDGQTSQQNAGQVMVINPMKEIVEAHSFGIDLRSRRAFGLSQITVSTFPGVLTSFESSLPKRRNSGAKTQISILPLYQDSFYPVTTEGVLSCRPMQRC